MCPAIRGYGYHILSLAMIWYALTRVSAVAADPPPAPSLASATVQVDYDPGDDRVSISAHQTSLEALLRAIAEKTPLKIDSPSTALFQEPISVQINRLRVEEALKEALTDFNSVLIYSSAARQGKTATARSVQVILLSRKATHATQEGPQLREQGGKRRLAFSEQYPLVGQGKGTPAREEPVASFLQAFRDRAAPHRQTAIVALQALAPDRAVEALLDLLLDPDEDRQVRLAATMGLGELGNKTAVAPLIWAVTSEPLLRQAAANSLAQIGEAEGVEFLLEVARRGDARLRQIAGMALFSQGDAQGQAALMQAIAAGEVPVEVLPKDVIDAWGGAHALQP